MVSVSIETRAFSCPQPQVNQLKQVIHELGSSGEEKELSVAFEAASGLSKETFTLLDKCPWNEEVNIIIYRSPHRSSTCLRWFPTSILWERDESCI